MILPVWQLVKDFFASFRHNTGVIFWIFQGRKYQTQCPRPACFGLNPDGEGGTEKCVRRPEEEEAPPPRL